jgi:hypothetical protein
VTATVLPFRGVAPRIDPTSFIAPGSNLMGDIEIGKGSSIWLGCQLRGDVNVIRIGEKVNLQDGSVVHVSRMARWWKATRWWRPARWSRPASEFRRASCGAAARPGSCAS